MNKYAIRVAIVALVIILAGCDRIDYNTLSEVTIIAIYPQEDGGWGTVVELKSGYRYIKKGKLGEPGKKFMVRLPKNIAEANDE